MARPDRRPREARSYRSPSRTERARRTRARIIAAAAARFVSVGYTAATVASIAESAGVSVPTVELYFRSKAQLLKHAIDVAIAGDDEPIPMLERDWARAAEASSDPRLFVEHFSSALRHAARRSAALIVVAEEAARGDAEIASLVKRLSRQRAVTVAWLLDGLLDRSRLRDGLTRGEALDVLWLLMDPIVFDRLSRRRGWTPRRFERWFTDSVLRLLLPVDDSLKS